MSNTKKTAELEERQEKEYYTVEELKQRQQTPDAVFEGTKVMNGWKSAKQLQEAEYVKAVKQFGRSVAGGR